MKQKAKSMGGKKRVAKPKSPKQVEVQSLRRKVAMRRGGVEGVWVEEALRASEEKYRKLFEFESDALFLLDKETTMIEDANRAAILLYGYSRDEMLAMNASELLAEPDKTRGTISDVSGIVPILYHRKKDGTVFPVEITFNDFFHLGRLMRFATVRNIIEHKRMEVELIAHRQHLEELVQERTWALEAEIAERKRAEKEIKHFNAHLEQRVKERTRELVEAREKLIRQEKLTVLGQMAGSVGHELRNPLAIISNAVYFLKLTQPDSSDTVKEHLNLIQKNVDISNKIIADLLDSTHVKSAERQSAFIAPLIQQALERFVAPTTIQVELDVPLGLPAVYADPQHVVQVLGNLVLNAYQAMPEGGTLHIAVRVEDNSIYVGVRDTGVGISPENMKKLFEPLFTTKIKGVGLGLAVTKKLIEANSGLIEVKSEAGKGSTFMVYLPIYGQELAK